MLKKLLLVLITLSGFVFFGAQAVPVKTLYQGNIPVANQSQQAFDQALPQAFAQVLQKVSGNAAVASLPAIQTQMSQARALVKSYRYINQNDQLLLQVQFDPNAVKRSLREANQAIWGGNRPLTLAWVVVQPNQASPEILASDNNDPLAVSLTQAANNRGLPILLPMMDINDMNAVTSQDLLSLDPQVIIQASKRYHASDILVGKVLQQANGSWDAEWMYVLNNQYLRWQTQGANAQELLTDGVQRMSAELAARYAVLQNNAMTVPVTIDVTNVDGLSDFAAVVKYLRSLTPVDKVNVSNVDPNNITVKMMVAGGAEALQQALVQQQKLIPDSPATEPGEHATLTFRWAVGTRVAQNPVQNEPPQQQQQVAQTQQAEIKTSWQQSS